MNLVSFSIKTKGLHNFTRRLWTVFSRFGFTEKQTRQALFSVVDALHQYDASPTFFIPAIVLQRHSKLINQVQQQRAEIGIHGYVHNDYRTLNRQQQFDQTKEATRVFKQSKIRFQGFRNPYLGWTPESVGVFNQLGFTYDSNEAVLHDVIDVDHLDPMIRSGYEKSMKLFQALPCTAYALLPHVEDHLIRIPTSIPDDEILFDRLRMTDVRNVACTWKQVMQRVYNLGGIYVLNLHPERALICQKALKDLLAYAANLPRGTWISDLNTVAEWWLARQNFRFEIQPTGEQCWEIKAYCQPEATILAHRLEVEDQPTTPWNDRDRQVQAKKFSVRAAQRPCIGLSAASSQQVEDLLKQLGYAFERCEISQASDYALFIDEPQSPGESRVKQIKMGETLLQKIQQTEAPLLSFGPWPEGKRAALSITGDIDSITIQDFFLRILEVSR